MIIFTPKCINLKPLNNSVAALKFSAEALLGEDKSILQP